MVETIDSSFCGEYQQQLQQNAEVAYDWQASSNDTNPCVVDYQFYLQPLPSEKRGKRLPEI